MQSKFFSPSLSVLWPEKSILKVVCMQKYLSIVSTSVRAKYFLALLNYLSLMWKNILKIPKIIHKKIQEKILNFFLFNPDTLIKTETLMLYRY